MFYKLYFELEEARAGPEAEGNAEGEMSAGVGVVDMRGVQMRSELSAETETNRVHDGVPAHAVHRARRPANTAIGFTREM